MTEKLKHILRLLDESSCLEAHAVADCLRDIAENDENDEDEFLIECAKEIRGWADYVITETERRTT